MSFVYSSGHWNSPSAIFSSHSCIIIINIIIIIDIIIVITWGVSWSMVQPTLCAVPRISLTTPVKLTELERGRMILPRGAVLGRGWGHAVPYPGGVAATPATPPTVDPGLYLAAWKMSSMVMLPLCLMFFTFLRSRCGSFSALMIRAAAEGHTEI